MDNITFEGAANLPNEAQYFYRRGATLHKLMRKIETSQHSKFRCVFCGKDSVCRTCVGFWHCKHCRKHKLQTHTQHTQSVRENERELERNPRRMMCVIIPTVRLLLVPLNIYFLTIHDD